MRSKKLLLFLIVFSYQNILADSWTDPTWQVMLQKSDLVALVKYTSFGVFEANAKVLKIYKGPEVDGKVSISGLSNRYGPINAVKPGDKYLVFLKQRKPSNQKLNDQKNNKSKKNKGIYYSWTPTSGDLKIMGKKVNCNLLETTSFNKQQSFSLQEFEYFLIAFYSKDNNQFHLSILEKIKNSESKIEISQYLMMLQLTGFSKYHPLLQRVLNFNNDQIDLALARLLGQIDDKKSIDLLIQLLDTNNSQVQGETVKQLPDTNPEFIGPILTKHLNRKPATGNYNRDIMNPVMNTYSEGKVEIIKKLGAIKYLPACEYLLPMLETSDAYMFDLIIEVLDKLDSREYVYYINDHLKKRTIPLIHTICVNIVNYNLEECRPSLMEFISNHNRNGNRDFEFTISNWSGIGHFNDSITENFLINDLEHFLTYNDTIESRKQQNWFRAYIKTFSKLKSQKARESIYKILYEWHGLSIDYSTNPDLFLKKIKLESTFKSEYEEKLDTKIYKLNKVIAFINNPNEIAKGHDPEVEYLIEVTIPSFKKHEDYSETISNLLLVSKKNIYLKNRKGWYFQQPNERFYFQIQFTPLYEFWQYASKVPTKDDITFLKGLRDHNFITEKKYQEELDQVIYNAEYIIDNSN